MNLNIFWGGFYYAFLFLVKVGERDINITKNNVEFAKDFLKVYSNWTLRTLTFRDVTRDDY